MTAINDLVSLQPTWQLDNENNKTGLTAFDEVEQFLGEPFRRAKAMLLAAKDINQIPPRQKLQSSAENTLSKLMTLLERSKSYIENIGSRLGFSVSASSELASDALVMEPKTVNILGQDFPILFSSGTIAKRVDELARGVLEKYKGSKLTLVPVLKGAMPFAADLMKRMEEIQNHESYPKENRVSISTSTVNSSAYKENQLSDEGVQLGKLDVRNDQKDDNFLIVEDVVDSGATMAALLNEMHAKHNIDYSKINIATLFDKTELNDGWHINKEFVAPFMEEFVGFKTDAWIVGYGLDQEIDDGRQALRGLPHVIEGGPGLTELLSAK